MKKIIPFLFLLMLGSISGLAQNTLLSQKFSFSASEFKKDEQLKDTSYLKSKYNDWDFVDHCYGIKNNYLLVGNSVGNAGIVTPPTIPFYGRAQVVVRIKQMLNNIAMYKITKPDGEVLMKSVPTDGTLLSVSFIVDDWSPSSSFVISNENSSYYVLSVEVYDIGPALFYESFNGMEGKSEFEHPTSSASIYAYSGMCDNSGSTITDGIFQTEGAILVHQDQPYTTPALQNATGDKALLTYKVAYSKYQYANYSVQCNESSVVMRALSFKNKTNPDNSCSRDLLSLSEHDWIKDSIVVEGLTTSSKLSFSGKDIVFFDDVLLLPLPDKMSDGTDNSMFIKANAGKVRSVTLDRRLTAGIWNTLCLPFDLTQVMFGSDAELRTLSSADDGLFVFHKVDEVSAGTPFLVKVAETANSLTFSDVTVQDVKAGTVAFGDYKFCGTYSPIYLSTDGTQLFLGTDGNFYKPSSSGNRMNGMRAYFVVPESVSDNARVTILDEPNAIQSAHLALDDDTACYDLMGRRQDSKLLSSGLYVRNGRKFYVK